MMKSLPQERTFWTGHQWHMNFRATINEWDLMDLKTFCIAKNIFIQVKRQLTEWEISLLAINSTKGYYLEYIKNAKIKQENKQYKIKLGHRKWIEFSKDKIQMREKLLKKSSTSLAIRKIHIKTSLLFHLSLVKMAKTKKNVGVNVGETNTLIHHCVNAN